VKKPAAAARPSLKSIARQTGLSVAAVSLALRNRPGVSPRTCARVQRAATRLGYQQDPQVAKLMAYLRRGSPVTVRAALGLLTLFPDPNPWRKSYHLRSIHDAATLRAAQLGYQLEACWLAEPGMTAARMRDILIARGIEGVVLLGAPMWVERLDFDFSRFACAATGYSIRTKIHRACQHQYQEMFILLRRLEELGYRRPALALAEDSDQRTMHHWSAAFLAAQQAWAPARRLPILIAPKITADVFLPWFARHHPDVVVTQSPPSPIIRGWLQDAGVAVPQACGLADLDIDPETDLDCSGIRQNYEQVAAAAVDLVVSQIQRNERGLPDHPMVVMIEGQWVDGATTARRG
jgi:LacI family transcriptional regulator